VTTLAADAGNMSINKPRERERESL